MSTMVGIIFFILSSIVPLVILGAIIYTIVSLATRNKDDKQRFKLSSKSLFQLYLYFISFLTLAFAVVGGATTIKASLSYPFGMAFSYSLNVAQTSQNIYRHYYDYSLQPEPPLNTGSVCHKGEKVNIQGSTYCVDYTERIVDFINGVTLFATMAILFLVHQIIITRIPREQVIVGIRKLYTFGSLIVYSVLGIVTIPLSIYQLTNYIIFQPDTYSYMSPTPPALIIGFALISLPLWIYFLLKTSKLKEEDNN
jgi:hypothetical protein